MKGLSGRVLLILVGGACLLANSLASKQISQNKEAFTSPKIEGGILKLIAEWVEGPEQAAAFSRKRGFSLFDNSLGVNIRLTSDESEIDIQKINQMGVRDFVRIGKWASGYVPIESIPELAEIDGVSLHHRIGRHIFN